MNGALRVLEHNAIVYRRAWRGSIFVSFVSPLLFLTAMGVGIGSLIARGPTRSVGGLSYLAFVAPGVLSAATMQTAFSEMAYPILGKSRWLHTYDGMLATPLRVRDLLAGEIGWLIIRLTTVAAIFFLVMTLFNTVHSTLAPLAIPVGVLNGLAFGGPMLAFSAAQRTDMGFAVIGRFVVTPLFILGGTFFPLDRLPVVAQDVAWLTPLAHGVTLARSLTSGTATLSSSTLHLAVLVTYAVAGIAIARLTFERSLAQ
ncbi:MAG: ABC transporter permease [Candidatus Dormibacteraeota bacterium]|nr:ABC transporter permease [Candidatus Dormibacteraeota bacterium]